jgi:hypothetical protein
MAVTAKFVPDHIEVLPNVTTTLTLRLYNDDAETREVALSVTGEVGEHVRLDSATATIETNQIVDVGVSVFVPSTVQSGSSTIVAEVSPAASEQSRRPTEADATGTPGPGTSATGPATTTTTTATTTATASIVVAAHSDYTIALQPSRSRGSKRGRHLVRIANTGNVLITLDVAAEPRDDVGIEVGRSALTLAPGVAGEVSVCVTPSTTYWSGPRVDHDFSLHATSADGRTDELTGTFQQRPRVPNWVGPASAGAFAALLLGMIAWFALLRPWVQDTADEAAAEAIEEDRVALRERIDELETAAAEAEELPLGRPFDVRLEVAPAGGNSEQDAVSVDAGTIVSITDVVFQNPTGAVGTVSLQRGDQVILQSELANFRDFDLHFVAPYQFDDDVEIVLVVECRTAGTDASTCPVAVSLVGFVDEVD